MIFEKAIEKVNKLREEGKTFYLNTRGCSIYCREEIIGYINLTKN